MMRRFRAYLFALPSRARVRLFPSRRCLRRRYASLDVHVLEAIDSSLGIIRTSFGFRRNLPNVGAFRTTHGLSLQSVHVPVHLARVLRFRSNWCSGRYIDNSSVHSSAHFATSAVASKKSVHMPVLKRFSVCVCAGGGQRERARWKLDDETAFEKVYTGGDFRFQISGFTQEQCHGT